MDSIEKDFIKLCKIYLNISDELNKFKFNNCCLHHQNEYLELKKEHAKQKDMIFFLYKKYKQI